MMCQLIKALAILNLFVKQACVNVELNHFINVMWVSNIVSSLARKEGRLIY